MAIAHEYLNQRGGGERVVLELTTIWPGAPIYMLAYDPEATFPEFAGEDVRTSFLSRMPGERFRAAAPLYLPAFRAFGRLEYDLVVSSAFGWSHMVATGPRTAHVVYCHLLWRPLYAPEAYIGRPVTGGLALPALRGMKRADRWFARHADLYAHIRSCGSDGRSRPRPGRRTSIHSPLPTGTYARRSSRAFITSSASS